MARLSQAESTKNREEILDCTRSLYTHASFSQINIKEIARQLSFTRTAIYTYFDNKEEIFLALLQREYELWNDDLHKLIESDHLSHDDFAHKLASSLQKRHTMLKILAVDMASLDTLARLENLVEFKRVYGVSIELVRQALEKHFPDRTAQDNSQFIHIFFPFLHGVYPYAVATDKQKEAMKIAHVSYVLGTITQIIENCILGLLRIS